MLCFRMKDTYILIVISLVSVSYVCSATTLGLGNLFGSRKDALAEANESNGGTVKDGDQHHSHDEHDHHEHDHHEHDHHDHDHHEDHHTHKPTHSKPSHAPLLPAIPHPADTPLNPQNNPHHPLNHISLPSLPSLPHRETILATKTVFVEVTSKVTQNPVCIAVHGVKPPCLPVHEYYKPIHKPAYQPYRPHLHHHEDIQASHSFIQPTTISVQLLEPTRILSGVSLSESAPVEESHIEPSLEDSIGSSRSGRYIEVATPTPAAPFRANSEIADQPDEANVRLVEGIFHRQPVTHYTTKTLWVTKVEKYIDHRVTATLEVKNCIPSELHIPLCGSAVTHHAPSYIPYKDGSFLENNSGHHSGHHELLQHHDTHKDKRDGAETDVPSKQ